MSVVALQVGKTGLSVGIDVRKAAVKLSTSNIKRLKATSPDFFKQAARCKIELHNVFMPSNKHKVSQAPLNTIFLACQMEMLRICSIAVVLQQQWSIASCTRAVDDCFGLNVCCEACFVLSRLATPLETSAAFAAVGSLPQLAGQVLLPRTS